MKRSIIISCAVLLATVSVAFMIGGIETLAIGDKAPSTELKMVDVKGAEHTLNSLAEENGLLVIFSCNTCPFVVGNGSKSDGWEGRYNAVYDEANSNNIGMVLVNSNEAKRDKGDSMADMKSHSAENGYKMTYVEDIKHKLADSFGARTTPHVFLFNASMELVYEGAIDDNVNEADKVSERYLSNAMTNLAAGKSISPAKTKAVGCSIKRVEQ